MNSSHIKEELNCVDLDHERQSISINKVINLSIFPGHRPNIKLLHFTIRIICIALIWNIKAIVSLYIVAQKQKRSKWHEIS